MPGLQHLGTAPMPERPQADVSGGYLGLAMNQQQQSHLKTARDIVATALQQAVNRDDQQGAQQLSTQLQVLDRKIGVAPGVAQSMTREPSEAQRYKLSEARRQAEHAVTGEMDNQILAQRDEMTGVAALRVAQAKVYEATAAKNTAEAGQPDTLEVNRLVKIKTGAISDAIQSRQSELKALLSNPLTMQIGTETNTRVKQLRTELENLESALARLEAEEYAKRGYERASATDAIQGAGAKTTQPGNDLKSMSTEELLRLRNQLKGGAR